MPRPSSRWIIVAASVERTTTSGPRAAGIVRCRHLEAALPRTTGEALDETVHLLADRREPDRLQELDPGRRRVHVGNRRRPCLETPRARRPVEAIDAEGEWVDATEPAGRQRLEPLDEIASHIEKRHPGGPEQILQRACHHEVHAQRMHVERRRAGPLIVVQQDVGATLATECRQSCDVEPVAVAEAHMRRRHDERSLVDARGIGFDRQGRRRARLAHATRAPRRCWASHTCPMVGNSNSPSTTVRRSVSNASAVAMAVMPVEAFGITAISSVSAPIAAAKAARSRSTSPTQRSHGDPCVCHDSVKAVSADSTSSDNAPCEQLFT